MNRPSDIELMLAELEARKEHLHCWHSDTDEQANNHDAHCCICLVRSTPTESKK